MSNRSFLFFCVFLLFSLGTNAQEELLSKGHQLAQNESYELAKRNYKKVLEQGYESTALYYNLGIVHYELNEFPEAILYFEKALKLDSKNENIQHNLQLARQKTASDFIEVDDFFLKKWWTSFCMLFSPGMWTALIFIFSFILIVSFYFYLFGALQKYKSWGMRSFYPLAFWLLILFFAANSRYQMASQENSAILLEPGALYQGPDERSEKDYDLRPGTKLKILNSLDGWLKVELINKESGWIKDENVGRI